MDNETKTTESYYDVLKFTVKAVYFTVFFNRWTQPMLRPPENVAKVLHYQKYVSKYALQ